MNEKYLHFIWKSKRLLTTELNATTGEKLSVRNFGEYNFDSGPDFFNGAVMIDDILHHGNIEMHVNSSDWIKHGHQFDPAYNNVILHVVYNHDMEILVNNQPLPTLELKYLIDWKHFNESLGKLQFQNTIPCDKQLAEVSPETIGSQLKKNTHDRLQRKASEIDFLFETMELSIHELLFHVLLRAFGGKLNALPFLQLANRIPVYHFLRSGVQIREAVLLGASGFLEDAFQEDYELLLKSDWAFQKHKLDLSRLDPSSIKFKGARPSSFPALRLIQFAHFSAHFDWSHHFCSEEPAEILNLFLRSLTVKNNDYWTTHYHLGKKKSKPGSGSISKGMAENIVINAVVPFLFWYGQKHGNITLLNKAVELLELIPQEKNNIVERWQKLVSYPNNARFGQAVIELNNQWCTPKKCLKCLIGKELMALS